MSLSLGLAGGRPMSMKPYPLKLNIIKGSLLAMWSFVIIISEIKFINQKIVIYNQNKTKDF